MSLRIRRGSSPTTTPGEVFGPTAGEGTVRANAGARAVSDPGGGISFTSAPDLASKITANPSGTIFVAANNIDWTQGVSTGSKAPKIWIPSGRIMDGGGRFFPQGGLNLLDGAELHGGVWQNFGSAATGEHNPVAAEGSGAAKLVQDCTFANNYRAGMNTSGNNVTVNHCTAHSNGRYGFNQSGTGSNLRYEFCEWYNNNTRDLPPDGDAGGTKFLHSNGTYVGFCWGHDNTGSGLWFDFNPGPHVVEENVFENNTRWGIFYEVGSGGNSSATQSSATANIHNNFLKDNCTTALGDWFNGVQLLSSCSDGLINGGAGHEIHHNVIDGTTGLAIGFNDHNFHPTDVKGCHIHDNEVRIRSTNTGRVGGELITTGTYPQGDPFSAAFNNTFQNNHYKVQNTGLAYWRWAGTNRTWSQWQALGHDNTGTLETI